MTFMFEAEVRLLRWSESSTAGRTITIELPPDAGDAHPFRGLPTGHQRGQRFRIQFSAIGDDEQLQDPKAELKGMLERSLVHEEAKRSRSLSGKERYDNSDAMEKARIRSVLLAKDQQFQMWTNYRTEESAAAFIRRACSVDSRSYIATDRGAYERFLQLEAQFSEATGRSAENRGLLALD